MTEATRDDRPTRLERGARGALVVLLAWHSLAWMGDPARGPADGTWLLHGVSLGMHETGHLVFAPFGEVAAVLGGSLLQLLLPLAFVAEFARRRRWDGAALSLWWVAQNGWDVAVYVADARAESLPLVGGGEHDWAFLLMRWHALAADHSIARGLAHGASALAVVALVWAAFAPASAAYAACAPAADEPAAAEPTATAAPSAPPPARPGPRPSSARRATRTSASFPSPSSPSTPSRPCS